jgi:xylulokinase
MSAFLGVDVSTTAAKAVLLDESGALLGTASTSLSLQAPRPLWSEQDPREWWAASASSIREVLATTGTPAADVRAIGLTGQMHGLVLLDGDHRVLRPAILWNDQRTGAQCDEIRRRLGGRESLVRLTGNDALAGFTAPKILWVREHEPELYARARLVLLPKDYVRLRLTGEAAMDKADASGTLLFDIARREWSEEVLRALEVPREWLPPTHEGPEVTGTVTPDAAWETGLRAGTPVVAGGGDQAAGAVGTGAVRPGVVALSLGTSGVIFASTDTAIVDPQGRLHAFCHAVPGKWHLMAVTLAAAGSLEWFRNTLAAAESFDTLVDEAAEAPAASEGALFLPYLSGERTPYADPLARGAFVGLTMRHGRGSLTRAVLEGVAFSMKDCLALIREAGLGAVSTVRVTGGGAKSRLWRQIVASALDVEIVTVNATEGAAAGAALLAAVGAGAAPSVEAICDATIRVTDRQEPVADWVGAYADAYPRYRALYPALKRAAEGTPA